MTHASQTSPAPAETTPNPKPTSSKLRLAAIASAGALVISGCSSLYSFDGECGEIIPATAYPSINVENEDINSVITYSVDRDSITTQVNGGANTVYTYAFNGVMPPTGLFGEPPLGIFNSGIAIPVTPPLFQDVYVGPGPEQKLFDYVEASIRRFDDFQNFDQSLVPTTKDIERAGYFDLTQSVLLAQSGPDASISLSSNHVFTTLAHAPVVLMSTCGFDLSYATSNPNFSDWPAAFSADVARGAGNSFISTNEFDEPVGFNFGPSSARQLYPGYAPDNHSFSYQPTSTGSRLTFEYEVDDNDEPLLLMHSHVLPIPDFGDGQDTNGNLSDLFALTQEELLPLFWYMRAGQAISPLFGNEAEFLFDNLRFQNPAFAQYFETLVSPEPTVRDLLVEIAALFTANEITVNLDHRLDTEHFDELFIATQLESYQESNANWLAADPDNEPLPEPELINANVEGAFVYSTYLRAKGITTGEIKAFLAELANDPTAYQQLLGLRLDELSTPDGLNPSQAYLDAAADQEQFHEFIQWVLFSTGGIVDSETGYSFELMSFGENAEERDPGRTNSPVATDPSKPDLKAHGWVKRISDSEAKMYLRDPVGAGKVQFMLNGREIGWVRAIDATDPKLRVATSGPMAGRAYFVRTARLEPGRKNVLEIYVAGERVRRVAYGR